MSKITCHVDESCLRHFVSKREPQPFMRCEYAMRIYHLSRTPHAANHFFCGSPYILVHNCTSILRSYLSPQTNRRTNLVIELIYQLLWSLNSLSFTYVNSTTVASRLKTKKILQSSGGKLTIQRKAKENNTDVDND